MTAGCANSGETSSSARPAARTTHCHFGARGAGMPLEMLTVPLHRAPSQAALSWGACVRTHPDSTRCSMLQRHLDTEKGLSRHPWIRRAHATLRGWASTINTSLARATPAGDCFYIPHDCGFSCHHPAPIPAPISLAPPKCGNTAGSDEDGTRVSLHPPLCCTRQVGQGTSIDASRSMLPANGLGHKRLFGRLTEPRSRA